MSSLPNGRILVVDDNESGLYAKRRILENGGFEVIEAHSGYEALRLAHSERPDLALLDIKLPDIDGYEVCRRLRADATTASMAIVHITASFERPEDHVRGLEAGADTFLLVPTDPSIVIATARALIRMRRAESALRESDRRKDEFLAVLAHELRNPLAPLRNGMKILELQSERTPAADMALKIMSRQVAQMVRLIDDLLEVSRINENKLELRWEHTQLGAIVESAVETCRAIIEGAGHAVTIDLPAETVPIYGDFVRLAQVVGNLVSNSAKYMHPGGAIAIEGKVVDRCVEISVTDTGLGIAAEDMPHIFDMFSQSRRAKGNQAGGLGIGLALVRRLVELHGGTVTGTSDGIGKGSRFVVRLPLHDHQDGNAGAPPRRAPDRTIALERVLVADDNADAAESLAVLLRSMGPEVRVARDGVEAVEVAAAFRPELVFMDIDMPRMNGLDAARQIRAQPWGAQVIICALTGFGQDSDRERSAAAGIDRHLVKPVEADVLRELMSE
jgi:signal transduction histidine kinase